MRSCVVLLFASLLTLCEAQGTIVTPVFVLKGRDLLLKLHADPPEGVLYVDWKINETVTLVRFEPSGESHVDPRFTGRVQFGENKFSATLKNVQEVDSGVYSAEARTLQEVKLLTEYKVTVQDPPSHRGWVIATWILTAILVVIVVGLIVWLYKDPERLIRFMLKHGCFNYEVTRRLEQALNVCQDLKEKSEPLKNMSPADA